MPLPVEPELFFLVFTLTLKTFETLLAISRGKEAQSTSLI